MPERSSNTIYAEREQGRKEVARLDRNPFVKETLDEVHKTLVKAMGLREDEYNFKSNVGFITAEDRISLLIKEFEEGNVCLGEFRKRGIMPKEEYMPQIPYFLVLREGRMRDIFITTTPFANRFPDNLKPEDQVNASTAAVDLYRSLVGAVLQDKAKAVALEADEEDLKKLAVKVIGDLQKKAEDPMSLSVASLASELRDKVATGQNLSLQAVGTRVELLLAGKVLETFYDNEATIVELIFNEPMEEGFTRRMRNSKVNGKKWFMHPEAWPKERNYRSYQTLDLYGEMKEVIDEQGFGDDLLNHYLNGDLASYLLARDGIAHTRLELTPEETEDEVYEMTSLPPREPEKRPLDMIKIASPVKTESTFVVKEKEGEVSEDDLIEREIKKLLRKERKAKKKKKNVKPQRTQQRFGKKDSSKSSKTTKEGAMHIVRPDPITAQFERMRRLLENKKRKQAAREKREARERELMEKQQQEERRKARLERQKKAREQKQTRGADSPQTVVIIETPLEKALREANAMQAVLEAEERARSEAQEGAAGSYAEGEKSFASGFEAGTTHSEIEDMEPNEEYLLEEDYEDEVSYKKFESIVRTKKFRD